jgi:uncharacterized RDD family membrane protein YckC
MNQTVVPDNPYAAPAAAVADEIARDMQLAGRGTRLGAVLIDGLLFSLGAVPAAIAVFVLGGMANMKDTRNMEVGVAIGIGVGVLCFVGIVAWNCVLLHRRGQTIAKKLLGIRVVRRDGSRCGLTRIFFVRYLPVTLLGMVPFVGGFVSLADALLIFRDDRRCLHDEIADTIVIVA